MVVHRCSKIDRNKVVSLGHIVLYYLFEGNIGMLVDVQPTLPFHQREVGLMSSSYFTYLIFFNVIIRVHTFVTF